MVLKAYCSSSVLESKTLQVGAQLQRRTGVVKSGFPLSSFLRRFVFGVFPRSISETRRRRIEGQEVSHVSIDIQFGNFVKMFFLLLKLALLDGSAVLQHGNQVLPKKFLDQFLNIRLNPFA